MESAPKKPMTAYLHFVQEQRQLLRTQSPEIGMNECMQIIANQWKTLEEVDRQKYIEYAEKDKLRYERELESFSRET